MGAARLISYRIFALLLPVAWHSGCIAGSSPFLELSTDFRLPREFADAGAFNSIENAWFRHGDLGIEGSVGAILEDPVLGAAMLAQWASASYSPGKPALSALQFWEGLYGSGDRLPFRIRWRFNKHFHQQQTLDPSQGWTFKLSDNLKGEWIPVQIGKFAESQHPNDWVAEYRIWFPRKAADGRLLLGRQIRALRLKIVGSVGDSILEWRFGPLSQPHEATRFQ